MWGKLGRFILRNRVPLLILLGLVSIFMAYMGSKVRMSYTFSQIIPRSHTKYQEYQKFKKIFGEDGKVLVLAVQTDKMFELDFFNDWHDLGNEINQIEGIEEVLSVAHAFNIVKNDSLRKFEVKPLFDQKPQTEQELDTIKQQFLQLPFYDGLIYNRDSNASLMIIAIEPSYLNSEKRIDIIDKIKSLSTLHITEQHDVEVHYSGLPFVRTVIAMGMRKEIIMFLGLAFLITAVILYLLFRSFYMVIFPLIVVLLGVVWSFGTLAIFGYEITLLTGLIPPLIVVIGIPNCIYLLNRYHSEFIKHGNKIRALTRVIEKVGIATLFTNLTTAIGFGVFFFTESKILHEFGLIAGINILCTFVISLITIPIVFSYLPKPTELQTRYLDSSYMDRFIRFITSATLYRQKIVFVITGTIVVIALSGIRYLNAESFMLDDVPKNSKEYKDLLFIQKHFKGTMPFEILISYKPEEGDSQKDNRTKITADYRTLEKVGEVQKILSEQDEFSRPISIAEGLKFLKQAYFGGNPKFYEIPDKRYMRFMQSYLKRSEGSTENLLNNYIDSTQQYTRVSAFIEDVGSEKLPPIIDSLQSKVFSVVDSTKYNVSFTGASVVFLAGNSYLITSLIQSLIIAFVLISFIMGFLFRSGKMLMASLIPNLIPLIITAGIMGYFGIPLKPSTVLIFSITYGISVDTSIHFLAKFQQELRWRDHIKESIMAALRETGRSMIYNSLILFCGFVIFSLSSFGGTEALGILTSITLIAAMFTNTIVLPALILTFKKAKVKQEQIVLKRDKFQTNEI